MKELWANIEKKNQTNIINLLLHLTNASNGRLAFNDSKVSSYCHQDVIQFRYDECGASADLARKLLPLEKERSTVIENCQPVDKLKDCEEYRIIEDKIKTVLGATALWL